MCGDSGADAEALVAHADAAERLLTALRGIAAHEAQFGRIAAILARLEAAESELLRVQAENADLHRELSRAQRAAATPRRRLRMLS